MILFFIILLCMINIKHLEKGRGDSKIIHVNESSPSKIDINISYPHIFIT